MTHSEVMSMLGAKYYRQLTEDEYEILRVVNIKGTNECICLINNKEQVSKSPEDILGHYTKLIPDGIISFAIVSTRINQAEDRFTDDVLVMARTLANLENNVKAPDLICRQNIVDIFHSMMIGEDTDYVGTSLLRTEVPANMSMDLFTACDKIDYIVTYNTYITDTPDTFINYMKGKRLSRFDTILDSCMKEYLKAKSIPDTGQLSVKGHCRTLDVLLKNNNFAYDLDTLYSITPIKESMEDNLVTEHFEDGLEYKALNSNLTNIFSNVFKMKISKTIVVKYDHDIDLSEFAENTIFLVRDNKDDIYVVRYTTAGEYMESELDMQAVASAMEHIKIVNKYKAKKNPNLKLLK